MLSVNLSKLNNEELVLEYRNGNQIAFNKLIEKNNRLIEKLVSKYASSEFIIHNHDEIRQIAHIGLYKATLTFDESTGNKFSTLCYKSILNEIRSYQTRDIRINKSKTHKNYKIVPIDSFVKSDDGSLTYSDIVAYEDNVFASQNFLEQELASQECKRLLSFATPRQKEIITLMSNGLTQRQVSVKLGVSDQCVNITLKNYRERLNKATDLKGY